MSRILALGFILAVLISIANLGCASPPEPKTQQETSATMPLASRTLEISTNSNPGLSYPFRVCTHTFIGICTAWGLVSDDYDLTNPVVKKQLSDAGFICTVEVKP